MNISCVICSEFLTPSADVFSTKCGHIFHYHCLVNWLERSKSCPQCRQRATENSIHRLFFNIQSSDGTNDLATVLNKVDNLEYQKKMLDADVKKLKENNGELKQKNLLLIEEVKKCEHSSKTLEMTIHALKDQISYFKTKSKENSKLSAEIIKLKNTIKTMENVEIAINGTRDQVNEMLRNDADVESLAIYGAMLKKAVIEAEGKKTEVERNLKRTQSELSKYKKECLDLGAKYVQAKRDLEQLRNSTDNEKTFLKTKIADLNEQLASQNVKPNSSLQRIALESPVNYDKAAKLSGTQKEVAVNMDKQQNKNATDSPYLQIRSNSLYVDHTSFINTKYINSREASKESAMFKASSFCNTLPVLNRKGVCYNGLGGSAKEDIFPLPKSSQSGTKAKTSSTLSHKKIKRLAPRTANTSKNVNISEMFKTFH